MGGGVLWPGMELLRHVPCALYCETGEQAVGVGESTGSAAWRRVIFWTLFSRPWEVDSSRGDK